ncbi:MAG: YqgE/AlgH family protein [Chitinophagaceae bacterium]
MISPARGTLLIANPFLKDPNFIRSVIFLCEHKEEGSFGFVLNKIFLEITWANLFLNLNEL